MKALRILWIALAMLLFSGALSAQRVDSLFVAEPVLTALSGKVGLWAECIVGISLHGKAVRVDATSSATLVQTPTGISPGCPVESIGFIHPDTSGKCELKPDEMAAWTDSDEVVRVVYCGPTMYHYYMQPRRPQVQSRII